MPPLPRDPLQATLANAVQAPYYRERFGERWREVHTIDDLATLPLLDKATAIRHQRELIVGRPPPGFGFASSGTSRLDLDLPPLNVYEMGTSAEALNPGAAAPTAARSSCGWTLVVVSVVHGLPQRSPPPGEIYVPWTVHRNSLHMLESVLSTPQPDGERVTAMRLGAGALKTFTAWLLERDKDPADFGVRLIGTHSFHLSPFWCALIENKFGAQVFDNYSLSEFSTAATECKACGWLHFGLPPLIVEVLDLVTGKRVETGVGKLVLTGEYPYKQKMPLIRYDTGDAVELGPVCPTSGQPSMRFLGRIKSGLVIEDEGRGTYLLSPILVQDLLESRPESERDPHPFLTMGFIRSRDVGLPRWTVAYSPTPQPTATLAFEVRFDPHIHVDHARRLEHWLHSELLLADKRAAALVERGKLSLRVTAVSAGTLKPAAEKFD